MNSVCPSHPISERSVLILPSYVGLSFQGGHFPLGFLIVVNNKTETAAAAVVVWWW
jgi:hypothetical protein